MELHSKHDLLLMSAARLYSLGVDLEGARSTLKDLVDKGVPYESLKMLEAYQNFQELDSQFKALERDYIELRDEIAGKGAIVD